MKLANIVYAATLFLSSSTLEVKASHGYWGIDVCCAAGLMQTTPTGMETACYWGTQAIGEPCLGDTGILGCAHGFCNIDTCAGCTTDTDCSSGSTFCVASVGTCATGANSDVCDTHDQCSNGYCALYGVDVAVDTKRCHDGSNGRSCDANDQCSSGYCNTSSNRCHNGDIGDLCGAGSDCQSSICDSATAPSLCASPPPPPSNPCLSVNCGPGGQCISMSPTDVSCRCENTFQEFLNSNGVPYCDCPKETTFNAEKNRCFAPPTIAPTSSPTKSPTAAPTLVPTSSPIEQTVPCADDADATFSLDRFDKEVGCEWLTKNWKKKSIRIERYCGREKIDSMCPATCGLC
ncbi:predicted protein [Chaetoceros tenuissimus]|uniref:ShKT domain-containing protein n=1 Tax=Chaetoceros tenuissimus TaxID=426638 RepID=A0AAD3CFW5_9STRA|nr:predicted protein [Chaetoceros tenuissimus]